MTAYLQTLCQWVLSLILMFYRKFQYFIVKIAMSQFCKFENCISLNKVPMMLILPFINLPVIRESLREFSSFDNLFRMKCISHCSSLFCRNLIQPSCRQGVCFSPSLDLGLTDLEMGNDDPIYDEPWDMVRPPLFPAFDIEYEVRNRFVILKKHCEALKT